MNSCAVVLLNYNGRQVLPVFLPSVLQHSTYDVWLIDNSSTDDSVDYIKSEYPSISLITLESNFGYAGGYNWGLEQLRGKYDYFILLNSDVEVTPGWDLSLVNWLSESPDYAALQPKIRSWQNRNLFDYAGAGGGFLDSFGYPYCRGRIWDSIEQDDRQYDDARSVDWASGACLVIRAADFFEQEGFDAHFFAHMEEIDLCWRLRKSGRRIGYLGSVAVFHQGGATLDRSHPNKLYLNIRNSLGMLSKNEEGLRLFGLILVKFTLEMLGALDYLRKGKKEFAAAIVRAYLDFLKRRHLFLRTKKKPEQEIHSSGPVRMIFWNYFILGRRKFSQL